MFISKIIINLNKGWSRLEKEDKLIIVVLLFSFLIRIISLFYFSIRGWDETVYLNLGHDLSLNPFFYSLQNSNWSDFVPSTDIVYGWPNIGFRAPLLSYFLSIFYSLKISFLIPLIIPFFAMASVFLVYVLGKNLFNKRVGLYSAMLFSLVPIHIYCSARIWTDAFALFFVLLTIISFWKGYEKNNKKHKILLGLFLALSLLSRYTSMLLVPIFILYLIVRDKSFKFLRDKYLWYAISLFFAVMVPLFIYGVVYYDNPLGSFIHGFKAASYYGGVQSWNYFIVNSWRIFFIVGVLFICSLFFVISKKLFFKREVYFLLIFTILSLAMAMIMPHKEDRYILLSLPCICLISGIFINNIKHYKNIIFGIICIVLLVSLYNSTKTEIDISKNKAGECFSLGNEFLVSSQIQKDSIVITNLSPIVHYYTDKKINLYPGVWGLDIFKKDINSNYLNKQVYIFFSNYDMTDLKIKKDLDNNFKKVFECSKDYGYSAIYKYE